MKVSIELLNIIADNLEAGEKCFIHKTTLEVVSFPEDHILDIDTEMDPWQDVIKKVELDSNYIQLEKLPSRRYFELMEEFANSVNDRTVKIRLLTALDKPKPFANFKHQIENSGDWRELWFEFRRKNNIDWVASQLADIQ